MYQPWRIFQYRTARGDYPVETFIRRLPSREEKIVRRYIELLAARGPQLRELHVKRMTGTGRQLYELRPGAQRIFYCAVLNNTFVLLHGYRKKSQRTPIKELATAIRRYDEIAEKIADKAADKATDKEEGGQRHGNPYPRGA